MLDLKTINSYKVDIIRLAVLLALAALLFAPNWSEQFAVVKYVFGFLIAQAAISHIVRRALFPYIDMRRYFFKALEEPLSASVVVFSLCMIVAVTIYSTSQFFS